MEQSIIDKYLEKKHNENIYPDFKKMLNDILNNYDISIFERIVYTFSKDNSITIDMNIVKLDNKCIDLVNEFIKVFDDDIEVIDYSNYSEIIDFVKKHANKKHVSDNSHEYIIDDKDLKYFNDKIDLKYFDDIDNFSKYLNHFINRRNF